MIYQDAIIIAREVKRLLAPHCLRIEIAGSIRRKAAEVKDIEIVCIPFEYSTGLFESGVPSIVNRWKKVKGEFPCRYTQRILTGQSFLDAYTAAGIAPDEAALKAMSVLYGSPIKLDLFLVGTQQWGLQLAIRTGSADFSHWLAKRWTALGLHSDEGNLYQGSRQLHVYEEMDLFRLLQMDFVMPEKRSSWEEGVKATMRFQNRDQNHFNQQHARTI